MSLNQWVRKKDFVMPWNHDISRRRDGSSLRTWTNHDIFLAALGFSCKIILKRIKNSRVLTCFNKRNLFWCLWCPISNQTTCMNMWYACCPTLPKSSSHTLSKSSSHTLSKSSSHTWCLKVFGTPYIFAIFRLASGHGLFGGFIHTGPQVRCDCDVYRAWGFCRKNPGDSAGNPAFSHGAFSVLIFRGPIFSW